MLFGGLFAGFLVAVLVIELSLRSFDASIYTRVRLVELPWLDDLAAATLIPALVATAFLVIFAAKRRGCAFWLTLTALMLLVAVFVTTLLVNVPINTEQLTWNVQAPPADRTSVRDRWHIAHAARTGAAVLTAVLTLWEDEKAVKELEASPLYRQTVEAILGSDLLAREQSVELFEVHAGKVVAGELAARLR